MTLERIQRQLQAIASVNQIEALTTGDVESAAREMAQEAAGVTGCERVNVWLFNDDESELRCVESYEATPACHSSGAVLHRADFVEEFEALRHARYVDADDALTVIGPSSSCTFADSDGGIADQVSGFSVQGITSPVFVSTTCTLIVED